MEEATQSYEEWTAECKKTFFIFQSVSSEEVVSVEGETYTCGSVVPAGTSFQAYVGWPGTPAGRIQVEQPHTLHLFEEAGPYSSAVWQLIPVREKMEIPKV